MRRLLVFLAACGSGSSPPREEPPPAAMPAKPLEPFRGSHGGTIEIVAVTRDGGAAISGDDTGGLRLWPTLDGTQEPIVLAGARATALAIARDAGGFAIAITDAAGQVELVRVDAGGHVRSRRKLGEARYVEMHEGVLVLRADHVIEHVAFDGTQLGRLAADSGTSIQTLAVGEHAYAIVRGEKTTRARRIELPLAWGAESPALAIAADAEVVVDGGKLYARDAKADRITQFDLATGKTRPVCPDVPKDEVRLRRFGDGRIEEPVVIIDKLAACVVENMFTWWNLETSASHTAATGNAFQRPVFAAARDRVVFAHEHELAIITPERTDYLGYGLRDLANVRSVPSGVMIGKGDQQPVLLDDNFRERARFALPKLRVDWTDVVPLDERYLLASSTRPGNADMWGDAYQLAIYDSVTQVMHQVLPHRMRSGEVIYEPATRMVVASDGLKTMLMQLDLAKHTIGNEVVLDLEAPRQIALLDPRLAGGLVAIAIQDVSGGTPRVLGFHVADMPPPNETGAPRTMRPRSSLTLHGEVRAIDRAGRLYLTAAEAIEVRTRDGVVATLPGVHTARLRPSPDSKHVVAIEDSRIALFTSAGQRVWETAAWGSSDVDWTASGVLYARFPQALARIDVATGALAERQCGWGFGIAAMPRDSSSTAPSVCDAR